MNQATCPLPDTLSEYTIGKLSPEEFESISEHLDECFACQSQLARLRAPDDTMVRQLQAVDLRHSLPNEAEFENAMRDLRSQPLVALERKTANTQTMPFDIDRFAVRLSELREYDLAEAIGQGGMGTVYRALHRKLRRPVAVKVLPSADGGDAQAVTRFGREMEAVARLDHPNIVRAYDAGVVDDTHFFVMELVDGVDLHALLKQRGALSIAEACELVRQTALGLAHAHEHDMVHRDVKPSNLMLTNRGELKILDLGLARLRHSPADEMTELPVGNPVTATDDTRPVCEITVTNHVMGTLDYMSPEQCDGSRDADAQSDIYSLGATLYKLLTNCSPYAEQSRETLARRYDAIRSGRTVRIESRRSGIPRELADLIHRMLSRSKETRFTTAQEVAAAIAPFCHGADLQYLATGKKSESPPARSETSGVGAHRNRKWLAVVACGVVGLLAVAGVLATIGTPTGDLHVTVDDAIRDQVSVVPPTAEMIDSQIVIKLNEDVGPIAYSPDGKLLATASCGNGWERANDTSIYVWSTDDAKLVRTLTGSSNWVHYLAFSPDANRLAAGGFDRTIRVWDLRAPNKSPTVLKDHRQVVYRVAFSPDGTKLVSASEDQIVNIWDLELKRVEHRITAHHAAAYVADFTADGKHVVSADWHGKVVVTDAETGEETLQFQAHKNAVVDLDFSPDGKRLATASFDQTAKLWSLTDGVELGSIPAHGHWVWNTQFSPDGKTLATSSHENGTVRLWDVRSLQKRAEFTPHDTATRRAVFSPDGKCLATGGLDGVVKITPVSRIVPSGDAF